MRKSLLLFLLLLFPTTLIIAFLSYTLTKSYFEDLPFYSVAADTLRQILGNKFVTKLEEKWYILNDTIMQLLSSQEEENLITESDLTISTHSPSSSPQTQNLKSLNSYPIKLSLNSPLSPFLPPNLLIPQQVIPSKLDFTTLSLKILSANKNRITYPPNLPVILTNSLKEEGIWHKVGPTTKDGKTIFFKTFIRPDPRRPYAKVELISIDLSKVKIGFVVGTNYKGSGKIPAKDFKKTIATFNGGFKPIHDNGGMYTNGHFYLPLRPYKATLIGYKNGLIKIIESTPSNLKYIKKHLNEIEFIRQNQPILIKNGKINTKVKKWGIVPAGLDPIYAWRTALGLTPDMRAIFAIGNSVSAQTLALALKLANVTNAIHLDMNISNIAFNFINWKNGKPKSISATKRLKYLVGRYIKGHIRDFFYIALK